MDSDETAISVEVAYALPHKQQIISLQVPEATTAEDAVKRSGIEKSFPEIDLDALKLGIFGKAIKNNQTLKNMDRVEVYRPLIADPKEVRKQRAAKVKAQKAAEKE